jgi:uncharacterized protein YjiS (DUF1127 family)
MVTTELTHSRLQQGAGERFIAFVSAAAANLAARWHAAQNRRSVAKLLEWDDRMLKDIGLTEGDVRSAMAAPAGQDPSLRLRALSSERRAAIRAEALDRLSRGTVYDPKKRKRRKFELLNFES